MIDSNSAIDFSLPFMPESLTPLHHTAGYARLPADQRLRYNQLNALYFNEQIMFFERSLAGNILGRLTAMPLPPRQQQGLQQFLLEEEQHSAMFARLNRACAPGWYSQREFHFIRVPWPAARLLALLSKQPTWFPMFFWLMHLQEERAIFFGRAFLKAADQLEPHFVAVQRKHLADEIGHVRWDEYLLDRFWPQTAFWLRRLNAALLGWMIAEYFSAPKRSALRVLRALMAEFPGSRELHLELQSQLLGLQSDQAYLRALYSFEIVPDTWQRFQRWPEFDSLARVLPHYGGARTVA